MSAAASSLLEVFHDTYKITAKLEEDRVWTQDISSLMQILPPNVQTIWNFCFTEMFNNAIDHSEGGTISVWVEQDATDTQITIYDDGVGIFGKIQRALGLVDERQAVLELSKGKFTTDSTRHTGQGIFFTSRMLESFSIMSGTVLFDHDAKRQSDWAIEDVPPTPGTVVFMSLNNDATTTTTEVFSQYREGETFGFDRTVVPVALAKYGNDQLVSRSQAKRVLSRVELFEHVVFDFSKVPLIGQAFADEIFRVFARAHPRVKLSAVRANATVRDVIQAAKKEHLRQAKAERRGRSGGAGRVRPSGNP